MAMHCCALMIFIGARFDDRVTGRLDAFSRGSRKIHVDIDPSSINKNVAVDVPIVADAGCALRTLLAAWQSASGERPSLTPWWRQIDGWRAKDSLRFTQDMDPNAAIKPQHAVRRLYEITRELGRDTFVTTEVGQHQMWAAQHFLFEEPNRWMT